MSQLSPFLFLLLVLALLAFGLMLRSLVQLVRTDGYGPRPTRTAWSPDQRL